MRMEPLTLYRPVRTSDNEGGRVDSYSSGATLYGFIRVHDFSVELIARQGETILPEDVVQAGTLYYRVVGRQGNAGAGFDSYLLELIERPRMPVPIVTTTAAPTTTTTTTAG